MFVQPYFMDVVMCQRVSIGCEDCVRLVSVCSANREWPMYGRHRNLLIVCYFLKYFNTDILFKNVNQYT